MNLLVIGGTGTVGSAVVRELVARGHEVSVLTRNPEKGSRLPAGVVPVIGDLLDPTTVRSAFRGRDAVFLLNALSPTEAHEGLMAVNGVRLAGVRRLVYMSVHGPEEAPFLPHFGAKVGVERAVRALSCEWTILRPNNFFQNDWFFKDAILQQGVYPQPIGPVGNSRVDVRDIAEAAAITLTAEGHGGRIYNLVGPAVWTGEATAAEWSRALGRPVTYGGDDMDAWERQMLGHLPPWLAFDLRLMYEHFQRHGLVATGDDLEQLTALLGHAPRRFEDFVAETARAWLG